MSRCRNTCVQSTLEVTQCMLFSSACEMLCDHDFHLPAEIISPFSLCARVKLSEVLPIPVGPVKIKIFLIPCFQLSYASLKQSVPSSPWDLTLWKGTTSTGRALENSTRDFHCTIFNFIVFGCPLFLLVSECTWKAKNLQLDFQTLHSQEFRKTR
jgi:hypothetical protein